ncbi:MAG: sigma-54-dependent Fis family transcriptional regulator [Sphingobacteriales bacterium]|nr:MAG: sigma-54-dependent Fis family transcriptional regulator [Sphingobacteriales bacterium]
MTKVFIVEDDPLFGRALQQGLQKDNNLEITVFNSGTQFLQNLTLNPDIVVADYNLPDMSGIEVLKKVSEYNPEIKRIIISGQEDVNVVVKAYKNGAQDYIIKNTSAIVELSNSIGNFSSNVNLRKEVDDLRSLIIDRSKYQQVIGESKAVLSVLRLLQKIEKTNMMVLITGESGTGKEVISKVIHFNSLRKRENFVPVNMAAIPQELIESELFGHEKGAFTGADGKRIGKFEEANRGTIFLDEIGEMDVQLQTKLLRVLQESTITRVGSNKEIALDVRVLAATNKNLAELVKQGKFREDLFYRLQGFLIHLPPLRERGNDVILLAKHFLKECSAKFQVGAKSYSHDAIQELLNYSWPGNIRELKSVVERAAIISESSEIQSEDLIFSAVM